MKSVFRNTQKIQIAFLVLISFFFMNPVAHAFIFVKFARYKVKDINPLRIQNVLILEDENKEEKWYLIKKDAVADCNIKKGDTIRAKLSTDSKKFQEFLKSEEVGFLERKLGERLGNRLLYRVHGCYNLEKDS
ncbi:hypothetical protein [Nodularia chucula]|uniref:hypothetical protein n=1 Tax=Nodularia chucula TaxID=3093667 RepID=UPI0039C72AE0